uniref:Integrase, catalytic region, zinc finger, CCHC-type, peptidase aspartic, catalytic n=1 Tax=Tanacetum cinerariifolium TaxID=118510 RepID=A0A6L2L2D7_TANCI|nr:hypothetical protein [Tanacetum cinerariifolium]
MDVPKHLTASVFCYKTFLTLFPIRPVPRALFTRSRKRATAFTVFFNLLNEQNPKPPALTDPSRSFFTHLRRLDSYHEQMTKVNQQQPEFPSLDSCLTILRFKQGDDPIDAINHMMSFLSVVVTSCYPTTHNQLRNSSNPRQQDTINDGRITLQPVQGRQISFALRKRHMSKQCTKPKIKWDDSWFKDKVLLVQAQANGQILHEEELAFLADPGITEGQATQTSSDALAEVHNLDNVDTNLINQVVQVMPSSEQSNVVNHFEIEITSDSNIIPYSQYKTSAIVIPDSEETIMLAEESRSKMLLKQKDQMISHSSNRPTKVEVPKELTKVSMVNTSLKKLKHHLASFDVIVKERTTAITITEGSWGFEHIKACFRDEINPLVKALKDLFNSFDQNLVDELSEVQNVFHQMEHAVEKHPLKNDLRKLKGKSLVDDVVTSHIIAPKMLKVDVEPLAPKLFNNRTAHSVYLRHTQEQAAILREVLEQGKLQNPLNNSLDLACKYTKRIQELLIIISQTCPCINSLSDKLVVVTPMAKAERVRFTEAVTSSGNTKTASSSNLVSNKPVFSSTRVKPSISASGSQRSGNTKKDKILRPPRSTQKNKVEAYPRTVKSSLKTKNYAVKPT